MQQWHDRAAASVLEDLNSSAAGLTEEDAQIHLSTYGPNCLPSPPAKNIFLRFMRHFHNVLIYVLLGSAIITALLNHVVDTVVILAVVVVNALIGFIQEGKAEQAMIAIRKMLPQVATVVRNGKRRSVPGENLVPGDIVLLEAGGKVPADIRLLKSHGLQIQEAILTGESVPVEKQTEAIDTGAAIGDQSCIAFSGTLVTSGQGQGVVVKTGISTEIGQISGLLSEVEMLTTPLVQQMALFGRWLTVVILLVAVLLLAFGYFVQNQEFAELFMAIVGLSVAAIPEGLPAMLTITLAVGVQSMAKRNVIVRRLPAIETLGSVSVICTDKTGTLTRNEMTVASVLISGHLFSVSGDGYSPVGDIKLDGKIVNGDYFTLLREIGHAALLCNDAHLHEHDGVWILEGDPMEAALLSFSGKIGLDFTVEKASWPRTDTIPFDAKHRFMATLHHDHHNSGVVIVKGAPEKILSMCRAQRSPTGNEETLDLDYWEDNAGAIAAKGQRVLALATRPVQSEHTVLEFSDVEETLTLLGMVGMIDPPRAEAITSIAECHSAGIGVKMITGDHAGTAGAIGRQIGLQNVEKILTGADIDSMDDAVLAEAVLNTNIFARTSPENKLRLVIALQSQDMTVAMTGDGVNDAPALKRADAGIAMGDNGSEAAKEAAELVLVDDNFSSIVAAVREGRTVYDNLKKIISWTLPTNTGEAMIIIVALLFGITLPITPVQILWVNLITAVTLGIALAFEPTEKRTMCRLPRPRNESLLNGELIWHILLVSSLFLAGVFGIYTYALDRGDSLDLARTMALNTLVVMEIFHLFFIRNIYSTSMTWKAVRGTKIVWLTVGIVTAAQFGITYLPPLQAVFDTEFVAFTDGLLIIGIGVALFAIIEVEKQIRLRLR